MSTFVVSARKYRPVRFEDVVGQEHISHTLKNALKNDHLAHAFLFCGPRGVGKTTCIIKAVESDPDHWANLARDAARPEQTTGDAIAQAARNIAEVIDAAKVVAYTATGSTALRLSRERPRRGIIAMSPRAETARQLCLQVLDVFTLLADHHARSCREDGDAGVLGRTLDQDARDCSVLELLLQILTNVQVLGQHAGEVAV